MKKKAVVVTIPDVRSAPARELRPENRTELPYPSARDLLSSSSEWAKWLEGAMRSVLKPAALAGVVGVLASGCAHEAAPPPHVEAHGKEETGVVMFPITSPVRPPETHPPLPTQGGGSETVVIASPLPDPPPVDGTHASVGPKPPVLPAVRPPMIRGGIRPVRPDVPMPGGIRPVF